VDTRQFISSLVSDLAWPFVVVASLILFRQVIRKKIGELQSISKGDAKAYFDATVGDAAASALAAERTMTTPPPPEGFADRAAKTGVDEDRYIEEEASPPPSEKSASAPVELDEDAIWSPIDRLVDLSPQYAVHEAGNRIDEAVRRVAAPYGASTSTPVATRVLGEAGAIPADLVPAINGLVTLRNRVLQSADFPVSKDEAKAFIAAARTVSDVLNRMPRGVA